MSWKDWSGYFAVVSYEVHHEHEYAAIRNACGLIDITPLFKYRVAGRDACRLIDRVITRDARKIEVGQVVYTHWCDAAGKVIDDGTVQRLDDGEYRWTAAEPTLRWIRMNAHGLEVRVDDVSESTAALALQGPTSRDVLRACAETAVDLRALKYFRLTRGTIAGVPVEISRTGYTGDLGYEIWVDAARALPVWDAVVEAGRPHDLRPVGLAALDVVRIEAGLILLDVDYVGARKALIESQKYTPYEIGLGRLVNLGKAPFVGQAALRGEAGQDGRRLVGLVVSWDDLEALYDEAGLPPQIPSTASRLSLPLYDGERQAGKATSSTWSPILKRMLALGTVSSSLAEEGTALDMEWTVDHRRRRVGVRVTRLPFFDPPRKRA
jgi:aminomethyltransferase